jgi:hypothetical protein
VGVPIIMQDHGPRGHLAEIIGRDHVATRVVVGVVPTGEGPDGPAEIAKTTGGGQTTSPEPTSSSCGTWPPAWYGYARMSPERGGVVTRPMFFGLRKANVTRS